MEVGLQGTTTILAMSILTK